MRKAPRHVCQAAPFAGATNSIGSQVAALAEIAKPRLVFRSQRGIAHTAAYPVAKRNEDKCYPMERGFDDSE
jgi:hypothetical protein